MNNKNKTLKTTINRAYTHYRNLYVALAECQQLRDQMTDEEWTQFCIENQLLPNILDLFHQGIDCIKQG